MMKLDFKWIHEAVRNVTSSATPIITLESSDPVRHQQLVAGLQIHEFRPIFHYTPWCGLREFNTDSGLFEQVQVPVSSDYARGTENDVRTLESTLAYMQEILRRQKAAFIVSDMDRETELRSGNKELMDALRTWAVDTQVMSSKSIIVLITSEHEAAIDRYTSERTALVRTELASENDRREIIQDCTRSLGEFNTNHVHALAIATAGLNLHHTRAVLLKAYERLDESNSGRINWKDYLESVKHFKAEYIRQSDIVEIEEPEICFEDVGGYEKLKSMIMRDFIGTLANPQRVEDAALTLPRGLLFFGPPGTGKTLFAKALARETNLPFINLKSENLFSMYLGESGRRLRDAKDVAEQASPAIVFIDEIDRFGSSGDGGHDGASQESNRVLKQMLEWLGDTTRKSIIVGTTNVPDRLDKAFIRPGRFSYIIPFPYPNREARLQILRAHLGLQGGRKRPKMDEASIEKLLPRIAEATRLYSGADLEELVIRAKREFFGGQEDRLGVQHFEIAMADFTIDMNDRRQMVESYQKIGKRFSNSASLMNEMNTTD